MSPSQVQQEQASSHLTSQQEYLPLLLVLTFRPTDPTPRTGNSQPITQSANGPRTFEEACSHFGFTHEEAQNLAFGCSLIASPSRTPPQVANSISQASCVALPGYPQHISGNGEHSAIPYSNATPLASLHPHGSPSTSTAPPRLAIRPDPSHVSHGVAIANQCSTLSPDRVEPPNNGGESPLMAFVDYRDSTFYCLVPVGGEFCGYLNKKKERMLSHIRDKHLDQRPWRCGGQCHNDAW